MNYNFLASAFLTLVVMLTVIVVILLISEIKNDADRLSLPEENVDL